MNSSKVILDKIIIENQAVIDKNINTANEQAKVIIDKATAESDAKIAQFEKTTQSSFDEIVRRRVTVANLDAKKIVMTARKKAVDDLFDSAKESVFKMDKKQYLAIIENILKKFAEDGDTVIISELDKSRITKKFVDDTAKKLGIKLQLSKEFGDFKGGVILSGKNCDKNLSLDVELESIREESETQLANMLFEE